MINQVAYYEIYCEKVRDLLNPSQDNLRLREAKGEGFIIPDVTEEMCENRERILGAIHRGKTNRATAPTLMNAESSRSHSILSLSLQQTDANTGRKRKSRLFLVDLAGIELHHLPISFVRMALICQHSIVFTLSQGQKRYRKPVQRGPCYMRPSTSTVR